MQSDAIIRVRGFRLRSGAIVRLAWVSWWLTLLFEVGFIGLAAANWGNDPYQRDTVSGWELVVTLAVVVVVFQSMATIGVLIVRRDPGNAVGWLFCASPLLMMAGNFFTAYAEYVLNTNPGTLPGGVWAGALGWAWVVGLTLFAMFVFLLFPDGHLPSRRWRPIAWVGGVSFVCLWVGALLSPGRLDSPLQRFHKPVGIDQLQYLQVAIIALPMLIAAGVVAVVVRYRRGNLVERAQLRWFVVAVCFLVAFTVVTALIEGITGATLPDFVFLCVLWLVPASVGIAILRYRLYEIDVIIQKTLVYTALAATLSLVYLGGISLTTWMFRSVTGQSSALAVTLSTLAVAAAFQPLRTRIQRTVDHRFYRRKYDSTRTLEAFNGRLREQIDLDALCSEVIGVATETLQPSHAGLWLRPSQPKRP